MPGYNIQTSHMMRRIALLYTTRRYHLLTLARLVSEIKRLFFYFATFTLRLSRQLEFSTHPGVKEIIGDACLSTLEVFLDKNYSELGFETA